MSLGCHVPLQYIAAVRFSSAISRSEREIDDSLSSDSLKKLRGGPTPRALLTYLNTYRDQSVLLQTLQSRANLSVTVRKSLYWQVRFSEPG